MDIYLDIYLLFIYYIYFIGHLHLERDIYEGQNSSILLE